VGINYTSGQIYHLVDRGDIRNIATRCREIGCEGLVTGLWLLPLAVFRVIGAEPLNSANILIGN
jgi:hypothetical protein